MEISNSQILTSIAAFTSLTKLHLTLIDADLQPLAQLSSLQDLALQVQYQQSASCAAVLDSNRHTLQSVVLSAHSWSFETYWGLHIVANLDTVVTDFKWLDSVAMPYLAGISARLVRWIVRGHINSVTVEALNTAKVHHLTLFCLCDTFWQEMAGSTSLQRLTVLDSEVSSNEGVGVFPNLTELTLINCHRVSALGVKHWLTKALPALASLSFWARDSGRKLRLSRSALEAMASGSRLVAVDLRGVSLLTDESLIRMQNAFFKKQAHGKVHSHVRVLLPLELCERDPIIDLLHCESYPGVSLSCSVSHKCQKLQLSQGMNPDAFVSAVVVHRFVH